MESITKFLNEKLMPLGTKIAGNKYVAAIRDTFIAFMPFLIIGSLFIIIQDFPSQKWQELQGTLFGDWFNQFIILPKRVTYDIMSIYLAAGIAHRLARGVKKCDPLAAAFLAIASFVLITPISTTIDVAGKAVEVPKVITFGGWFGTDGILVALLTGIIVSESYSWFIKKNIVIKMPDGVPPAVSRAFAALIPGFVILTSALIVNLIFRQTPFGSLHKLVYTMLGHPISSLVANNVVGAILTVTFISLFWFLGLNGGSIVNGIMRPFWVPLQDANMAAIAAGQQAPNVITEQFFDMVWIGGAGATLGVVIFLVLRARSKQFHEIGKVALLPGCFNINEPVMFGLPIVLNPFFIFPLVLGPIAIAVVNFLAMYSGIVARPTGVIVPWATPPFLQGFLITGSISGAILQLVDVIMVFFIWAPFIMIMDKKTKDAEDSQQVSAQGE